MTDLNALRNVIRAAFRDTSYPGDDCLRRGNEGEEPFLLEDEFKGRTDWQTLDARFLDQAPDGFATALSFFSAAAFHFYLPAYLIADIDGKLQSVDPVFHLCFGLDDANASKPVNPQRYGEWTWFEEAQRRMEPFTAAQAAAVVAYLRHQAGRDDFQREMIEQALNSYWLQAAGETD